MTKRRFEMLGGIEGAGFESVGEHLIGTIYVGLGHGKKPTTLLLHGLPGFEKNVDIAYALREAGWNVLIPHYRGCWGSDGNYRFTGIPTDVKNAITLMETKPYVDEDRIYLVGHSLGAWAAIITAAQEDRIKGVVAIAGGITSAEVSDRIKIYLENIIEQKLIKGITSEEALQDWRKMGRELASQDWIAKISPRPLLMIGGAEDTLITPEQVKALFERAKEPKKLVIIEGADHVFTKKRRTLVKKVTSWLNAQL